MAPGENAGTAGDRILDQPIQPIHRVKIDHRAEWGLGQAGVAGDKGRGLARELLHKHVGDARVHHDPLGGHADLALVHEGPERGGSYRFVEVGVVEGPTSGALPPSSSSTGFRWRAATWAISRPTRVEPVKLTRRTAG